MPKIAEPPLDDPGADIILRSSDEVDFHVHKVILSMASPFFRDLPSLSQSTTIKDIPVIPFEEDSTTLDRMLRYCYPCTKPNIETCEDVVTLANAASKYGLDTVTDRLEERYMVLSNPKDEPVKTFMFASQHRWMGAARTAAKFSLHYSMDELVTQGATIDFADLKYINYHKLLEYHLNCRAAYQKVVNCRSVWNHALFSGRDFLSFHHCDDSTPWVNFWSQWVERSSIEMISGGRLGLMQALPVKSAVLAGIPSSSFCRMCEWIPTTRGALKFRNVLEGESSAIANTLAQTYISFG